jgi:tRNA pseudouridine38-40 synthase
VYDEHETNSNDIAASHSHADVETPAAHDASPASERGEPQRFKLIVCYDGHDFHGWQKQEPADREPLRTVQMILEHAVRRAVRQPITLVGASRTDAGVHAEAQVAAFTTIDPVSIPIERLARAINKHLESDVAVVDASIAPLDFDPIAHARRKAYRYTIHNQSMRPVFDRHRVLHFGWHTLDDIRMNDAAQHLVGEHDFASFANTHHGRSTTVREIFACTVTRDSALPERIHIDVTGSGFLYHMVRIITGTLIGVGCGRFEPADVDRILKARDRTAAGPTAPPEGLCLKQIWY